MITNSKSIDVVAIGNAIVDVLINTDDSFLLKHSLSKGNMALIDEEKAEKLYKKSSPSLQTSGGSAANTIAGLSNLGVSTSFIGRVKEDELGEIFRNDLCSTGAMFNTPPNKTGPSTARCFIYITPDAERTMCTYLGSSVLLDKTDIDFSVFRNCKVLYLEGYLWDLDEAKNVFQKAAQVSKSNGGEIALSLSDLFCIERHRKSFQELIEENVNILFGNEEEIIALYQSNGIDNAIAEIREKCDVTVLTRGASGSIVITANKTYNIKPFSLGKAIDSTGAGDLYASGFLYGYTNNLDLELCGKIGSICAGHIVTRLGSRSDKLLKKLIEKEFLFIN